MKTLLTTIFLASGVLTLPVQAYPVGNASFQDDGTGTEYPDSGSPNAAATSGSGEYYEQYDAGVTNDTSILGSDWSVTGTGGWNLIDVTSDTSPSYNNRFQSMGTSDGSTYAFVNEDSAGTITSTPSGLTLTIQPLTTYTLTIAVGNPTETGSSFSDPSARELIQFLADGSALDSALFPLATVNVSSATSGTFTDYTATFTTGATDVGSIFGDSLAIQMGDPTGSGSGVGAFDNVRLSVESISIPEPSTWALLSISIALLVLIGIKGYNRKQPRAE